MGTHLAPEISVAQIEPNPLATVVATLNPKETTALATPAGPAHKVIANLPYAVAIVPLFYCKVPAYRWWPIKECRCQSRSTS